MKLSNSPNRFSLIGVYIGEGSPIGTMRTVRFAVYNRGKEQLVDIPISKNFSNYPPSNTLAMAEGYLNFYKGYPQLMISFIYPLMGNGDSTTEPTENIKETIEEMLDGDDVPF